MGHESGVLVVGPGQGGDGEERTFSESQKMLPELACHKRRVTVSKRGREGVGGEETGRGFLML